MKTQFCSANALVLEAGQARRLSVGDGVLSVIEGRIWLTGSDGNDHVLPAGSQCRVADAQRVVVEPWERGSRAVLRWRPSQMRERGPRWRDFAGAAWAALARKAASSASRTHGAISACDSIASSGAVK